MEFCNLDYKVELLNQKRALRKGSLRCAVLMVPFGHAVICLSLYSKPKT